MRMRDKLLMIWAIVLIAALLITFGYWLGDRALPEKMIEEETEEELSFDSTVTTGDNLFTVNYTPTTSITFGDDVGRLSWEDGTMKFEGDAAESAKIFFDYFLIMYINDYIEDRIEEPEMILFEFTTEGEFAKTFRPQLFLKITGTDLNRCFIDDRLRVDLNGEIYWIRLEK